MPSDLQHVEVTLETLLDSVSLAEEICMRITEAAGFNEGECYKISMAVREGVINAVNYGNGKQRGKKVHLIFERSPEKLTIHVADQGAGFNLADVPDPLTDENLLKSSGRGIFLMRTFMDEFEVRKAPSGGAELVMTKRIPHSHSAGGKS
ncbi:MAG: ATP-binding protein [Candidatus Acidiferrales bacterium]